MSDELVEKVAQAMLDNAQRRAVNGGMDIYLVLNDWHREDARTALALIRSDTLEEAAKECGLSSVGLHFAAAIRAMKERT